MKQLFFNFKTFQNTSQRKTTFSTHIKNNFVLLLESFQLNFILRSLGAKTPSFKLGRKTIKMLLVVAKSDSSDRNENSVFFFSRLKFKSFFHYFNYFLE